ncbi:acyltransferase [Listeria aquatica]|uniref:Acyltransferase n=1 Tax=Listeria aquatica TaxID=1494960 RepID=A0A841ZRC5_9LIST|nr:acyltransferase [Listeria aquatica]MBC1522077.1 acyltransferase [Listeria aquatica]
MEVVESYQDVASIQSNTIHLNQTEASCFFNSSVRFKGTGNVLFVEDGAKIVDTKLLFAGNNSVVYLAKSAWPYQLEADLHHDNVLHFGRDNSFNGQTRIILSEQKHLFVGDDNMFSYDVLFRNADPHLIYDVETKKRLNLSQSIFIGDHVWVGQEAKFLKGTQIGSGAIAAGFAVLTKKFPSNASIGGNPAKVLKRNVFWMRPAVHAFKEKETEASLTQETDDFSFKRDSDTFSFAKLDAALDARKTPQERLVFLKQLAETKTKNRFFIGK